MGSVLNLTTGQAEPLQRILCERCGSPLNSKQLRWCSDHCRIKAWEANHPRLDFTPAASEKAQVLRKRESRAMRILGRLQEGPATSLELLRVGGIRYSARIFELRQRGHRITTEEHAEFAVYRLEVEP